MIDQNKRKTLKALSVSAAVIAGGTIGGAAIASIGDSVSSTLAPSANGSVTIQVTTRVSVISNDLEIVLTNSSGHPVTMTQISPQSTHVARGEFNFSALFDHGPVPLGVGESVSVPLQRKSVSLVANPQYSVPSLKDRLSSSLVVTTEGDLLASVRVMDSLSVA